MTKVRKLFFGLSVCCAVGCCAVLMSRNLAVTATVRPGSESASVIPAHSPAGTLASPQRERGPVRMVRFVLFEEGIFPQEMRIQQGRINLQIEDKTNSTSGLVIERVAGSDRLPAAEVRRFAGHWRGKELINLTSGSYRIYDRSRPTNSAVLIVEP